MTLEVTTKVQVEERDDEEVTIGHRSSTYLLVHSHWNVGRWVRLEFGGNTITVSAQDLRRAIDNAEQLR